MKRKLKLYFWEISVVDAIDEVELKEQTEQVLTDEQYEQIQKILNKKGGEQ